MINSICIILETCLVQRMHDVWQMSRNVEHINITMHDFLYREINCFSCRKLGLTNSIVYDIPQFLVLKAVSDDSDCISLIDDFEQFYIRPSPLHPSFEYNAQTVLIVLEEDNIVYLRKTVRGYSTYNSTSGNFELVNDLPTQQAGLASKWTVFIYETPDMIFELPSLQKIRLDQNNLALAVEPEPLIIDTVQGLLRSFTRPFDIGSIEMKPDNIKTLLDSDGDLNDLIIDAHLLLTASNASPEYNILTVPSYLTKQIVDKQLKQMPKTWLDYDMLLCPINQGYHWYILIVDLKRKHIVQLDSLPTHNIPRSVNLTRLLHVLNIQHYFRTDANIDFHHLWKFAAPDHDPRLHQHDLHSCGVHLLIQARAYVNNNKFIYMTPNLIQLYRHQIAEDLLHQADIHPDSDDSYSSVRNHS